MKGSDRNHSATSAEVPSGENPDVFLYFLKLPTENIVVLKFLLESYEGLGEVRTINQERGEVVILAAPDTEPELRAILDSSVELIKHREIEAPASCDGDWLLREHLAD